MTRSLLVLVTGGNRRFGLEACRQLAGRARVILTSRGLEDTELAVRGIGGQVEPHRLDVADPQSISGLASDAMRKSR